MYKGSCLCGKVTYQINVEPDRVSHCHCNMCQKQHGAAFATYASFDEKHLEYLTGEEDLVCYNSSGSVTRKFCKLCGSSIEWKGNTSDPGRVAIAISTFDTPYSPKGIIDIYSESKACWLDGYPRVHAE